MPGRVAAVMGYATGAGIAGPQRGRRPERCWPQPSPAYYLGSMRWLVTAVERR
jgi:hypothetical protein